MPPYEEQDKNQLKNIDSANDSAKRDIENAKKLLEEKEREQRVSAVFDEQADKRFTDMVRDALPDSAKEAGSKLGGMIESGVQHVKDVMPPYEQDTVSRNSLMDDAIETAEREMKGVKKLLQAYEREMVDEATQELHEREMVDNATPEDRAAGKSIDKIGKALPESGKDAGSNLEGLIDSGAQKVADAMPPYDYVCILNKAINKAHKEIDKVEKKLDEKEPELVEEDRAHKNITEKNTEAFPESAKDAGSQLGGMIESGVQQTKDAYKEHQEGKKSITERVGEALPNSEHDAGSQIG